LQFMMLSLVVRVVDRSGQRSVTDADCAIACLPLEIRVGAVHATYRVGTGAFQVPNAFSNGELGRDRNDYVYVLLDAARGMQHATQFSGFPPEHRMNQLLPLRVDGWRALKGGPDQVIVQSPVCHLA